VPVHPPDAVHVVAFVEVQVSVDNPPDEIMTGLALRETVDGASERTARSGQPRHAMHALNTTNRRIT